MKHQGRSWTLRGALLTAERERKGIEVEYYSNENENN
jgi:hypothetical protein